MLMISSHLQEAVGLGSIAVSVSVDPFLITSLTTAYIVVDNNTYNAPADPYIMPQ